MQLLLLLQCFSILPSLLFLFVYARGDLKMEECLIEDSHQQKKTDIIHGFKFFNEYLLCVKFPSLLLLLAFSSYKDILL